MKARFRIVKWLRPAWGLGICLALVSGTALGADTATNWKKNCASCHGPDGKGKTKAGRKAGVKDQTDAEYQKSLTDEQMFASIKNGLTEDGKTKMKPYGEKLSDDEIKDLVKLVRGFVK